MLSNNQIKLIKSLSQKKYRHQLALFTVEGVKGVIEFLNSDFELHKLYSTGPVFDVNEQSLVIINERELKKISSLKSPNKVLAIFKIPDNSKINESDLVVALDDVRDPGNLGTIIRLCDWFGVKNLICSTQTVDCYNPKVVQATMGSLARVNITYQNLEDYISSSGLITFGTFMDGDNIYNSRLPDKGIVILGNEANGISNVLAKKVDRRITIPQFGDKDSTESLNVANATAIILSEFRRQSIEK